MVKGARRQFVVCHVGAREHYAVARLLHREGLLRTLITDAWVPPGSLAAQMPGTLGERLRGRHHASLDDAEVAHFTADAAHVELRTRLLGQRSAWDRVLARNEWFQSRAVRHLERVGAFAELGDAKPTMLAYSYAARQIFKRSRESGLKTVLCQIDGGEEEDRLVAEVRVQYQCAERGQSPPARYWQAWREECGLADTIIVNSEWSRDLLVRAGADAAKIVVVPVMMDRPAERPGTSAKIYPAAFSNDRPLRVLLLGTLAIRKGITEALDVARRLTQRPVHFDFVGPDLDGLGAAVHATRNATWHGAVPRSRVHHHYARADVFLFPTHSDGFGMTQVEAHHHQLPVIASRHCAHIVMPGETGLILSDVSGAAIEAALEYCIDRPHVLARMSANCSEAAHDHAERGEARFLEVTGRLFA